MHAVPPDRVDFFSPRRRRRSPLDDGEVEAGFSVEWDAREPGFDRGDAHSGPWLVGGRLRAGEALLIDAESPDHGTTEARSLARCVAFGSPHLGVCPERTCAVAIISPHAARILPPANFGNLGYVPRPVHLVVDLPFLDREVDRLEIARCLRHLSVDVAIFDPASFADRRLSRVEREHHLTRAAEACLLVGATPVFVLLRAERARPVQCRRFGGDSRCLRDDEAGPLLPDPLSLG